jgi:hypothetical protein
LEASVRVYPCPECGLKVDTDRLAVLDVHARVDTRYENSTDFQEYAQRHLAHLLVDHLLQDGYIAFERGDPTNDLERMVVASLGVVSKNQVATFEQRVARNQDQLANAVVNEAIKQIDNWGSHYGRTGIAKDVAAGLIRYAASFVSKTWSKAVAAEGLK